MEVFKKLFVVSDIHGYGDLLKSALDEAGFRADDTSHIFVCCGDLFDNENENANEALCAFMDGLPRKILILGDREEMLSQRMDISERLRRLLGDMKNYYETENYLFVHGWIPFRQDFRTACTKDWQSARKIGWNEFYGENEILPDKTIVCGHIPTRAAYAFDDWALSDHGVYKGNGVLAVNGGVEGCGKINVLILKERLNKR